jgi:L-lactate dehydrogenase complex protein LldG
MSAKENILKKIREAVTASGRSADTAAVRNKLAQHPRGPQPTRDWEVQPRFRARCISLSSTVDEVNSREAIPQAVARYLAGLSIPMELSCWPEFSDLDWKGAGVRADVRAANGHDPAGVTGVYCAVAETGTLMILSGGKTPLVNSLLPETHIAVVPASRIVSSMEEGFDLLRREHHGVMPRQVSFVSGPSRTADIELTLVLGIHGPARVHVIVDTSR